jgi:HK97 family phage major capsid protein
VAAVTKDEIRSEIADRKSRIEQLETETEGARFTQDQKGEWNRLNTEIDELEEHETELVARAERLLNLANRSESTERLEMPQFSRPGVTRGDDVYDLSTVRRSYDDPNQERDDLRDRAMRAVEMAKFPVRSQEDAQDQTSFLVDNIYGSQDEFSRHLLYTGSPAYKRAFTKYLASETRTQREDELLNRAASLTTTAGGFAVPFVLDPTIIQTGSGAINPYRQIGNVIQINVDEWRGVSSAGITAAFAAEAAVTTDNAPTLAQPTVSTERGQAFVPFSIEIGQDWASFASEMANMLGDAKDVLEATKFAVGSGTNEPFGVITGATTVFTASNTNSLVVADIYGVHNALGPRFRRNAVWTIRNEVADRIRQLDTAGGANLWIDNLQLRSAAVPESFVDGRMGAGLLGKPAYEATGQSGTFTTGQLIGVIGDYGGYFKIVDRIGLSIEVIPHLFGAAQGNLPVGQRGLYAYWRVGAKVLDANAFRTLKLA